MNRYISLRTPAIVLGVLVFGALSLAQGGGGRQRGFGGGGMGGRNNPAMLLRRSDVQTDLGISADQKSKLDDLMTSMRGQRGQGGAGGGTPPTDAERQARRAEMESRMAEMQKKVDDILTQQQLGRLKQISLQLRGNMALTEPDIQKEVGLSGDQISKIKGLQETMQQASQSVMEKMRDQSITRDQAMAAFKTNTQAMNDSIGKILTHHQMDKLKELQGAPFKADPAESMGGFGRGGRRNSGLGGGGGFGAGGGEF
jgi:hypothetical protein